MVGKKMKNVIYIPPSRVVVRQSTDLVAIEDGDVAKRCGIFASSPARASTFPAWSKRLGCRAEP